MSKIVLFGFTWNQFMVRHHSLLARCSAISIYPSVSLLSLIRSITSGVFVDLSLSSIAVARKRLRVTVSVGWSVSRSLHALVMYCFGDNRD